MITLKKLNVVKEVATIEEAERLEGIGFSRVSESFEPAPETEEEEKDGELAKTETRRKTGKKTE